MYSILLPIFQFSEAESILTCSLTYYNSTSFLKDFLWKGFYYYTLISNKLQMFFYFIFSFWTSFGQVRLIYIKEQDFQFSESLGITGWGTVIRTQECRSQSPMPYRLAIPQYMYGEIFSPIYCILFLIFLMIFFQKILQHHQVQLRYLVICYI